MNAKAEIRSALTDLERRLMDAYQRGFPLSPTPYADMARALGTDEAGVLAALERLQAQGIISRVGVVVKPRTLGASALAAMAVPAKRLEEVAALVSVYPEVNHNYEREDPLNLWFVAVAPDETRLAALFDEIETRTGLRVLRLPMIEDYHIDLGFKLKWA
jgi:DNA-binding Lrp family transcriptional regulator